MSKKGDHFYHHLSDSSIYFFQLLLITVDRGGGVLYFRSSQNLVSSTDDVSPICVLDLIDSSSILGIYFQLSHAE